MKKENVMSRIQKLSIAHLVETNYKFVIPRSYQRGYRWRADNEVSKFLNDINESQSDYSLQPLILCEKDEENKLYDVVDGQQRLTTILLVLGKTGQFSNFSHDEIDNDYIEKAKAKIASFKESLTKDENTRFLEKVNKSFFISYIVEGDEDEVRKIFTRVNEGKIPLSSAELLKAWFFTLLPYKEVREKWNEMEKMLEDDFFFYFINPEPESPRYYATRMDYLVELVEIIVSGGKKDREAVESNWEKDKNYVFFSLSEKYKTKNVPEEDAAKAVFEELYSFFTALKACYDDIDTYNRIGFLINRKNRADHYEFLTSLVTKDIDLNREIKSIVGESEYFDTLDYSSNHDKIKIENILLLFNLTFYRDSRFDFKIYQKIRRNSGWSLDHIHAKNEELLAEKDLKALEGQIDCSLLEEAKKKYPPKEHQLDYQNLLYDLRDHAQEFDKKTKTFVVVDVTIEKWINGIGNLVLLEHNQNSSFNNASVKDKLTKLDEKVNDPDERRKLFKGTLSAYELARERKLWLKNESDKYLKEIKVRVTAFLNQPTGKIRYINNCSIGFSSVEKDYGNNIDKATFDDNESVNLMDILRKCEIVIPDFQREYAQGRCDKHSEFVREMFLNDIFGFLKDETKEKMELDFIYGRINDRNEFFPFDGQQRLTTLFLIYAELCRDKGEYADLLSQKFRYADRPEAEAYCVSCVRSSEEADKSDSANPSVKGMQEMRKAIKSRIQEEPLSGKEIGKLDSIVFYAPSDISLSTDIYWKMNSRGKRLTPLERFKSSWFVKGEEEKAKGIDKITVKFFNYGLEKYEESFMSLISIMFSSFSLIESKGKDDKNKINFYDPELVPSSAYVAFKTLKDGAYVKSLDKLFEAMSDEGFDLDKFQNNFIESCPSYSTSSYESKGKSLFFDLLKKGNLKEKSLLFSYLLTAGECHQIKDWMRFCANIIWNASELESALELIFRLSSKADGIRGYLASDDSAEDSDISQYTEERIKAYAVLNNKINECDIERAEDLEILEGRISVLLDIDGAKESPEKFKAYLDCLDALWDWEKDCKRDGTKFSQALLPYYMKKLPETWIPVKFADPQIAKDMLYNSMAGTFSSFADYMVNGKCRKDDVADDSPYWIKTLCGEYGEKLIKTICTDNTGFVSSYWGQLPVLWAKYGCTWHTYNNVVLSARNEYVSELLAEDGFELTHKDCKVDELPYFKGWEILLTFEGKYHFRTDDVIPEKIFLLGKEDKEISKPDGTRYCVCISNPESVTEKAREVILKAENDGWAII